MTNFDYIKTLDADQAGMLICRLMDDLPDGCDDCPMDANSDYDATAELAIRRVEIEGKINLLETTAKLCMPQCTEYLIMGVTEDGVTYNTLHTRGMPYSQNTYFRIRQKFYHLISKKI